MEEENAHVLFSLWSIMERSFKLKEAFTVKDKDNDNRISSLCFVLLLMHRFHQWTKGDGGFMVLIDEKDDDVFPWNLQSV